MKNSCKSLLSFALVFGCNVALFAQQNVQFSPRDVAIFEEVMQLKKQNPEANCADIGRLFIGTPYVAKTLDQTQEEHLVVNLRELDCTTFAETVLALWLLPNDATFDDFCQKLQLVRYRDGELDGYTSRLHYISDWVGNNEKKGLVRNISRELGGEKLVRQRRFMTQHPECYLQLCSDSANVAEMKKHEQRLDNEEIYHVPKEKIADIADQIPDGSIIAITTILEGLDVSHVGMAVKIDEKTHFLHASIVSNNVTITQISLAEYVTQSERNSGIIVIQANKLTS